MRDLTPEEEATGKELKAAYAEARSSFIPRGGKASVIPAKGGKPTAAANDEPEIDDVDFGDDAGIDEWAEEEEA